MYPHLMAVIFRSEGMDDKGVFSIAFWKPFQNAANGASAPAANELFKNERLVELVIVYGFYDKPHSNYSKNGTPGVAYLRIAS